MHHATKARSICAILIALLVLGLQPARAATLDTVECELNVTITFISPGQKMKSNVFPPTTSDYTIDVTQAKDLDPGTLGTQACRYTSGGVPVFRSTLVTATPTMTDDDHWTCEAVLATGTWTQTWSPGLPPDVVGALYTITGTWGNWELTIRENAVPPRTLGVMPLTFATINDPNPAAYAASLASYAPACVDSSPGIASLALYGVEVLTTAGA